MAQITFTESTEQIKGDRFDFGFYTYNANAPKSDGYEWKPGTDELRFGRTVDGHSGFVVVDGSDFKYDENGRPSSGHFTSIRYEHDGKTVLSYSSAPVNFDAFSFLHDDGPGQAQEDLDYILFRGSDTIHGSAGTDILHAGSGSNEVFGGIGNDTLYGGGLSDRLHGGKGQDQLWGGLKADRFIFDQPAGAANSDTIMDFAAGVDKIELKGKLFGNRPAGDLDPIRFKVVYHGDFANGLDSTDRIIYDKTNHDLYFDADGSGNGHARLLFAHMNFEVSLSAADFIVV